MVSYNIQIFSLTVRSTDKQKRQNFEEITDWK